MILCVDTCTKYAGVALADENQTRDMVLLPKWHQSESILPAIDEVLKRSGMTAGDLTGVAIIKGPGSFTSLRVGISVANQFAHQLGIPIAGLRADEWWQKRTVEKKALYLQSMNRDEIYNGKTIIPVAGLKGAARWMGELSDDHRQKLPHKFQEITEVSSPEKTWPAVIRSINWKAGRRYDLMEPFYGKEPHITKSKKRVP